MAGFRLELPTIQNWTCHNCSGCCRQHQIEITDEERRRIEEQGWHEDDRIPSGQPTVVWYAGPLWKKRYRLAHQSDGACIFLEENGLCRIHATFGEEAKPLACRIYPYAFHPAGKRVAVSLRFSCPSVVANRGKAVSEQRGELRKIARLVVPDGAQMTPPPGVSSTEQLEWPEFLRFVDALDSTLAEPNVSIATKLLRALFWTNLVEQSRFDKLQGSRLGDFLQLITQAAVGEVTEDLDAIDEPSRTGRMQFRMLSAQYARRDTLLSAKAGWRGRWKLLRAAMRFARGTGNVSPLQPGFQAVPFLSLERPFGGLPDDAEEIFSRYFRVKVQGIHFCGPAYYGVPFVEGFRSLALIFPVILWLARWLAVGEKRDALQADDVAHAMAVADHHHGYSPAFGQRSFRRRVRMLAQLDDISKLCAWYCR